MERLRPVVLDHPPPPLAGWADVLLMVKPETVVAWHRAGFGLDWRRGSRSRGGRPRITQQVRRSDTWVQTAAPWCRERQNRSGAVARGSFRKPHFAALGRSSSGQKCAGAGSLPHQTLRPAPIQAAFTLELFGLDQRLRADAPSVARNSWRTTKQSAPRQPAKQFRVQGRLRW